MKLANYKETRSPSQHFTKQTKEQFFVSCLSPLSEFVRAY